ncbi:MAG: glycoside hydrolase family 3 C-terminal domain-containing protein, partial [Clostridia bacterium]
MLENIKDIVAQMTLEEKAVLCSGRDFWTTKPNARLNIPSIAVSDGPHGLRKENELDNSVGMKESFPATSFPPAVNLASTWNPSLAYAMGEALADQCKEKQVSVILGPGTNIKRSPLCGRNFEYLSEDPFLAGKMCNQYIHGVQDNNVGTSLKHFCANNQEKLRMRINAVVDERTLREIYLPAFEEAVKAQPASVMCAYNRLNGVYLSDNKRLLTDILRTEWGFEGVVVSDWNATNDRVEGVRAGMDLEMPSSGGANDKLIIKAVEEGQLNVADLDRVVERLLTFVIKYNDLLEENHKADYEKAHELARSIAQESMVLLKNSNNILPLTQDDDSIAVIGDLAKNLRYQGSGSSRINPYKLVSFTQHLDNVGAKYDFAPAYNKTGNEINNELFAQALECAKTHKKVILFVGLTDDYESEGYDRSHLNLPTSHDALIEQTLAINPNTVVVLLGGSPVAMPWLDKVSALLNAYLPGEAGGEALYDVLFGQVNPSGKLAETYPLALDDFVGSQYYPMGPKTVEYREGIFVGYRYYDTANKKVLFPFGYGLSYTKFEYSNLHVVGMNVSFDVTNIGKMDGAEISQVYIHDCEPKVFKANKELKGFAKTFLKVGEKKTVTIQLDQRSFSFYNTAIADWSATSGKYDICVGASVEDIRLKACINITFGNQPTSIPDYKAICPVYYDLANAKD